MPEKTWTQIEGQIAETFRKWRCDPPTLIYTVQKRSASKRYQTKEERTVTIEFRKYNKPIRLTMSREERAIENLEKIALAVEHLRLAEVRTIDTLVMLMYRQMYPQVQEQKPPPPPRAEMPRGPYAVLHIANDAPLEVAEAAYRALTKKAHPDLGGDTATMQRLNAAIEQIRREHAK